MKKQLQQTLAYNTNSAVGYINNSEDERFYTHYQFPLYYQHRLKLYLN